MKLPTLPKSSTFDVRLDPETGALTGVVNGKPTPAADTILAAFHYDAQKAFEYARKQGVSVNANGWRAAENGAYSE